MASVAASPCIRKLADHASCQDVTNISMELFPPSLRPIVLVIDDEVRLFFITFSLPEDIVICTMVPPKSPLLPHLHYATQL